MTANRGVLCELYQEWELAVAHARTHALSFHSMNFYKSTLFTIWHLQPLVHCVVTLSLCTEIPTQSIGNAQSIPHRLVKVIPEHWLTSLSVHWNRSDFLRAIWPAAKNHIGERLQRNIYPRPPWMRQRNLFTIICLLSFFRKASQHFREEPIISGLFVNGQCCG